MKKIFNFLTGFLCLVVFYGMIYFAMFKMIELPTVYKSHATNSCKHVIDKGIELPCDKIPEKYHLVYVE